MYVETRISNEPGLVSEYGKGCNISVTGLRYSANHNQSVPCFSERQGKEEQQ